MTLIEQIAKHFRAVHFGSNWTDVNLKDTLADISWNEAITKRPNFNTIAVLVYHINYYVEQVLKVFHGEPLTASDKFSFAAPELKSENDWEDLKTKTLEEAELFAKQIELLEEEKLFNDFTDPKYGNYYYNIHGIIEHTHYHLGQIVILKKLIREEVA